MAARQKMTFEERPTWSRVQDLQSASSALRVAVEGALRVWEVIAETGPEAEILRRTLKSHLERGVADLDEATGRAS